MHINATKPTIITRLAGHDVLVLKQNDSKYTDHDKHLLKKLEESDLMVRGHEKAHVMAANGFTLGDPTYRKIIGPDGRAYAVEGEVKIDLSSVPGDPSASLRKAQTLRNSAMAPSGPSGADYAALDSINQLERMARRDMKQVSSARLAAQARMMNESIYSGKRSVDVYA